MVAGLDKKEQAARGADLIIRGSFGRVTTFVRSMPKA